MSFLLRIVEGPNKGAEVALVEGVAVTLGKTDDCDITLADMTMPDSPLKIETSPERVSVDGEALEPFLVKTIGATSFAVGPADAPWDKLKWPALEKLPAESAQEPEIGKTDEPANPPVVDSAPEGEPPEGEKPAKRGHGCLVFLVMLLLFAALLAALGWHFREKTRPWAVAAKDRAVAYASSAKEYSKGVYARWRDRNKPVEPAAPEPTLADVAAKYGLALDESRMALSGNLATRRERLAATAEAYAAMPGAELDLSDDESFRQAAEDGLFTLTEGALMVVTATNRFLQVTGVSASANHLESTMAQLVADLPKLRGFDASEVSLPGGAKGLSGDSGASLAASTVTRSKKAPVLPVCGILTAPYPCLVMKDGARVLEGAAISGWIVKSIGADSVILTNATGRMEWKP